MKTTAIILAAGASKRLKPIITSKSLLPFFSKPLVSYLINDLKSAGIKDFLLVVSPQDKTQFKVFNLPLAVQKEPRGMADALLQVEKKISTNSIMVFNGGDILAVQAIKDFVLSSVSVEVLLTGMQTDYYLPGGYFKLENQKPVAIIEKPDPDKLPSQYFSLVMHYFKNKHKLFKILKKTNSQKDDLYEKALSKIMANQSVDLFEYQDYFVQIKYPYQILDAVDIFLNYKKDQDVFIDTSAKIMKGAVIKNSYIGPKAVIGNNCLIRDSIIESNTTIGYNTEIARSYIGSDNWFHCNYVGDSVIEGGSNLGSGTRLANLRFDKKPINTSQRTKLGSIMGKNSQLGINTSIMPGVTIGAGSIIGSGVILSQDVKPKKKVFVKQNLVIR